MAITAQPLAEAIAHHAAKTPVGSVLRSREWARMPRALRNRAQFSAGVESARYLQRVQDGIGRVLAYDGPWDRSRVIRDLIQIAEQEGLRPTGKDRGGLLDPGSERRTELIYSMQTQQAYGHAEWKAGQDPDALDAAPAQELVRVESRKVPRDWLQRWVRAGGRLYDGRMIALKTDPIWERISRFKNPWPPFDFGSGMGLEDVLRSEAEALGVIPPGAEPPAPTAQDFNERVESEVRGLGPELRENLRSLFGPQVDVDGEVVRWNVDQAQAYESDYQNLREVARSVFTRGQGITGGMGLGADVPQESVAALRETLQRSAVEISAVATGRKPIYHEDLGLIPGPKVSDMAADWQAIMPQGVRVFADGSHLYAYHPSVSRMASGSRQLRPQVIEHADDGKWLGYGVDQFAAGPKVVVRIRRGEQTVAGFIAPRDRAELYGAARARDWADATGDAYTYTLTPLP